MSGLHLFPGINSLPLFLVLSALQISLISSEDQSRLFPLDHIFDGTEPQTSLSSLSRWSSIGWGKDSGSSIVLCDIKGLITPLTSSSRILSRTARKNPPPPISSFQTLRHSFNCDDTAMSLVGIRYSSDLDSLSSSPLSFSNGQFVIPGLEGTPESESPRGTTLTLPPARTLATTASFSIGSREQVE